MRCRAGPVRSPPMRDTTGSVQIGLRVGPWTASARKRQEICTAGCTPTSGLGCPLRTVAPSSSALCRCARSTNRTSTASPAGPASMPGTNGSTRTRRPLPSRGIGRKERVGGRRWTTLMYPAEANMPGRSTTPAATATSDRGHPAPGQGIPAEAAVTGQRGLCGDRGRRPAAGPQ